MLFRSLPYLAGGYQNSPQEKGIKKLLTKHKFVEKPKGTTLKDGEYIYQPNGENASPDFYVQDNDKIYCLECKSTKNSAKPVFNGGMPDEEYIYIYCSGKYDQTTIFYGRDVVPPEVRKIYNKFIAKFKELVNECNDELNACKVNVRGFNYYCRNMFTQAGKKEKTNYFVHKDRSKCEQNVLNTFR